MSYKLFLDDMRSPPGPDWQVVRSYDAFITHIKKAGPPDTISFDYQLGSGANGYDAALWLKRNNIRCRSYFVHSSSSFGRSRIRHLMESWLGRGEGVEP